MPGTVQRVEKTEIVAARFGRNLRLDRRSVAGSGRGSDEACEFRVLSLCDLVVHGGGRLYSSMDLSPRC